MSENNLTNSFLEKIGYFGDDDSSEPVIEPIQEEEQLETEEGVAEPLEEQETAPQEEQESEENYFTFEEEVVETTNPILPETKVKDKVKYDLKPYVDNNNFYLVHKG